MVLSLSLWLQPLPSLGPMRLRWRLWPELCPRGAHPSISEPGKGVGRSNSGWDIRACNVHYDHQGSPESTQGTNGKAKFISMIQRDPAAQRG